MYVFVLLILTIPIPPITCGIYKSWPLIAALQASPKFCVHMQTCTFVSQFGFSQSVSYFVPQENLTAKQYCQQCVLCC